MAAFFCYYLLLFGLSIFIQSGTLEQWIYGRYSGVLTLIVFYFCLKIYNFVILHVIIRKVFSRFNYNDVEKFYPDWYHRMESLVEFKVILLCFAIAWGYLGFIYVRELVKYSIFSCYYLTAFYRICIRMKRRIYYNLSDIKPVIQNLHWDLYDEDIPDEDFDDPEIIWRRLMKQFANNCGYCICAVVFGLGSLNMLCLFLLVL